MVKEIECPGESLLWFILWGEQVPAYKSFSGEPDKGLIEGSDRGHKKLLDYYHKGKAYSEQFDSGEEFISNLKAHSESCKKCSDEIEKLREKYETIKPEQLESLTDSEKDNLRYFNLLP